MKDYQAKGKLGVPFLEPESQELIRNFPILK